MKLKDFTLASKRGLGRALSLSLPPYTPTGTGYNLPFFDVKIVYSYVIEIANSESDGLHGKDLVSEILAIYLLLENARGRPGRRGHVHLGQNFLIFWSYKRF